MAVLKNILIYLSIGLLLIACNSEERKRGNLAMNIQTEKFKWTLNESAYYLSGIEGLKGKCAFLDSNGKVLAGFGYFFAGEGWGRVGSEVMGAGSFSVIPAKLDMSYYDATEDQFYRLQADLPQAKIYEVFKSPDIYWLIAGQPKKTDVISIDPYFTFAIAPLGDVSIWAIGRGQRRLVAHYTAKPFDMDWEVFNKNQQYLSHKARLEEREASLNSIMKPELVTKLLAGYKFSPALYQSYRVVYPWYFSTSSNLEHIEYYQELVNKNKFMVFKDERQNDVKELKAAPEFVRLFFEHQGKRYKIDIEFFLKKEEERKYENNVSEMMNIFQTLYPNRIEDDNAQYEAKDFTEIRVEMDDSLDTDTLKIFAIKGDQKIEIKKFSVVPNSYKVIKLNEY